MAAFYARKLVKAVSKRFLSLAPLVTETITTTIKITTQLAFLITFLVMIACLLIFHTSHVAPKHDQPCLTAEYFARNLDHVCFGQGLVQQQWYEEKKLGVIPKRLHQTFSSVDIPEVYHRNIRSWMVNHPDWEYYFWTDTDAERMIHDRYPQYTTVFQNYNKPHLKSDAIRYFILHQYGGLYTDMDVQSLKPIESFLSSNSCVVVPEPYVQTRMIFNQSHSLTNSILASVPNHPFLDMVLKKLNSSNRVNKDDLDIMRATGPFFLNETYNEYSNQHSYCKKRGSYCNVYVAHYKYLVPTYDFNAVMSVAMKCRKSDPTPLNFYNILACQELMNKKFVNKVTEEAYSNHLWLHIGRFQKDELRTKNIGEIVPRAVRYGQISHE